MGFVGDIDGFRMGIMRAGLVILGTCLWRIERLEATVRTLIKVGPRSSRWMVGIPSEPAADESLVFLIVADTCAGMERREGQASVVTYEVF